MFFTPISARAKPPVFADNYSHALKLTQDLDIPILLIFGADWCAYCVKQKRELWANVGILDDIIILSINIDNDPDTAKIYGIRKIPTTVFLKSGNEKDRKNGYSNLADFKKWLKKLSN